MGTMARAAWTRGRARAGPLQSGPLQQVKLAEPAHEGTDEYPSSALPVVHGRGRQSPDQAGEMAAELAGWTSGELPGQMTEQLASWPPGMLPATTRRVTLPRSYRAFSTFTLIGGFTAAS
jgi:hypothetical protein